MSWHYLPELAAEYLVGTCLDGDASAQSNTTSMQETYCSQGSEMDACRNSQSGTTCEHSTEPNGEEWLTLYRAAFHAKTYHQPEKEQESREQKAGYGKKWLELSVKYDRDTHSWKTHRCLFDEDLPQSLVTLPKWGMMQRGVLFRLRTAEHLTKESVSGVSLGTPTATMRVRSSAFIAGRKLNPAEAVTWPTPRANDGEKRGKIANNPRNGLPAAAMYSTPCARDWKDNGKSPAELARNSETLASQPGGKLNPTWVEWLMGWPLGWTDCDVSAMDKFQSWQQHHGVG